MQTDDPEDLHIGELARRCGTSVDAIRLYERVGLLTGVRRGANGYRLFPLGSETRVRAIRAALAFGFRLAEIAPLLAERDRGGAPCRRTVALAEEKLAALRVELADLRRREADLAALVAAWSAQVADLPAGERASLLHALAERSPVPTLPSSHASSGYRRRKDSR